MKYIPPYHYNFDRSHCWQCCMRSVLEGLYFGQKWYKWQQLDTLTGKRPNLWSWPFETFANLDAMECEAHIISDYDFKLFAEDFEKANLEFYGEAVARENVEHSDVAAEIASAKNMFKQLDKLKIEKRTPTVEDIRKLLSDGYLIIAWVNPRIMRDNSALSGGHYITIYDITDTEIIFHDSGPTSEFPADRIGFETYLKASRQSGKSEGIFAFRPSKGNSHA